MPESRYLRAIDLCAGAGGWACAVRGTPIRITHAFDRWPRACQTYHLNHPETATVCADLTDPGTRETVRGLKGRVDLVLGGIPCEWVSIMRNGWNPATRTPPSEIAAGQALLDAVLGLVADLAPRWWCLEDVPGLAPHLPPMTPYQEINAADWSAQRRKRIYVGEFPAPRRTGPRSPAVLEYALRPGPFRIGSRTIGREPATASVYDGKHFLAAYPMRKSPTVCSLSSRRDAELAVVAEGLPGGKRQLEWQEAARLQGFPEDYVFVGSPSDTWKMIGQAIQIDLGRAIIEAISLEADPHGSRLDWIGSACRR